MTCGGCVRSVTNALKGINGVSDAKVSLDSGQVVVHYDELLTSADEFEAALLRTGYGVEQMQDGSPQA
jgi:copper chaperone